jgi:hypothetical protein
VNVIGYSWKGWRFWTDLGAFQFRTLSSGAKVGGDVRFGARFALYTMNAVRSAGTVAQRVRA